MCKHDLNDDKILQNIMWFRVLHLLVPEISSLGGANIAMLPSKCFLWMNEAVAAISRAVPRSNPLRTSAKRY